MNKTQLLEKIYNEVGNLLIKKGFKPNKAKDLYTRNDNGFKDVFDIHISYTSRGNLAHHARLSFTYKPIEKLFKVVDAEVRQAMGYGILNIPRPTCSITDWKDLYKENKLPLGSLWFTVINSNDDFAHQRSDYETMINIALSWYEQLRQIDQVKKHCLNSYSVYAFKMYLSAIKLSEPQNLEACYQELIQVKHNLHDLEKKELELFYNIIKKA